MKGWRLLSQRELQAELDALEATYAAEAAIRRQECDIALQRWRLMRKGLPMAAAHAVAAASIAAGAA
jgi:hypothetical protein